MAKIGRPSLINPQLLDELFDYMAMGNAEFGFFEPPQRPSWRCWCKYKQDHSGESEFMHNYVLAKESCYKAWEFKIMQRCLDESRDQMPDGKGGFKSDNTATQRDRLVTDNMKWLMSKLMNKVYGDKTINEHTGKIEVEHEYVDRPANETFDHWAIRVAAARAAKAKDQQEQQH